jgi:radical SAM superfamily enzyme YgiQ (UPF0313 family)
VGKPKLQIIVLFQNLGDQEAYFARSPAPPLSGALVAGLTPPIVEVELLHEMVRPIDYDTDADFIALSFMDFCAPHAYDVARRFRERGKTVVAGGRYASTFPDEVAPHVDAVVVGEAERIWPEVVEDLVAGRLRPRYKAPPAPPLDGIPPPRYDLVEPEFDVPVVTEATRGCPYDCSFCQLTIERAPFRTRPIGDVINDLTATARLPFHKRKLAMLYDNNLGGDIGYAKDLLREIAKLKLWALGTQFSFDCLHDDEFVDLLAAANCTMAFIGLESLSEPSLLSVHKKHNRVAEYRELFEKLKHHGIMTFTGLMLALDEDTPEYYESLPVHLDEIDPSVILLSISIPIPGTPFHKKALEEGRIIDGDLSHYEGDHLVITPKRVSPEDVFEAFQRVNRTFYSRGKILRRWWRLVSAYRRAANPLAWCFHAGVTSYVFLKLSAFQKDHAEQRVYPLSGSRAFAEVSRQEGKAPPGA